MIKNNLNKIINYNYYLNHFNFIIFCDFNKAKNFNLAKLKNEIKLLNCKSLILNSKFIQIEQKTFDLMFLGSHILAIFIYDWKILLEVVKILNYEHLWFFYLHFNNLSGIINSKIFQNFTINYNIIYNFNFLLYRLIVRISLVLLLFIRLTILLICNYKI